MNPSLDVLVGSLAAENRSVFRAHLTLPECPHDCGLIADAPDKMRCILQHLNAKEQTKRLFKHRCKARKPKHFKAQYPGHCIALDTIVRDQHEVRRYVLTAIDVYTRMATAVATNRCNSRSAAAFLRLAEFRQQ